MMGFSLSCMLVPFEKGKSTFRGSSAVEQWTVEASTSVQCAWKTCVRTVGAGRRFCSAGCKGKHFVDQRRKKLKRLALAYKGGACDREIVTMLIEGSQRREVVGKVGMDQLPHPLGTGQIAQPVHPEIADRGIGREMIGHQRGGHV